MLKNLLVPSERLVRPVVDGAISLAIARAAHLDAVSIGYEATNEHMFSASPRKRTLRHAVGMPVSCQQRTSLSPSYGLRDGRSFCVKSSFRTVASVSPCRRTSTAYYAPTSASRTSRRSPSDLVT
jgi:hypothetical protein